MNLTSRCAVLPALLWAASATAVQAAEPPPPPLLATLPPLVAASAAVTGTAVSAAGAAASAPAAERSNRANAVQTQVIEDDKVRIEEKRLRGQTQAVTVHSKLRGVADYEVIMPPLGKDPSQDKGAAGKRTWSLFDF